MTADSRQEYSQTVSGFLMALTGYLVMGIFLHMSYIRYFWLMLAMADASTHVVSRAAAEDTNCGLPEVTG